MNRLLLLSIFLLLATAFAPQDLPRTKNSPCDPIARPFKGYTFIHPNLINKKAAYAPFFLDFGKMYEQWFDHDHQRDDNLAEWNERFCTKSDSANVDYVVYRASIGEMSTLLRAASDPTGKTTLSAGLAGNSFAEVLAFNHCTEPIEYLIFAKKCQPHVSGKAAWEVRQRDADEMDVLIEEGLGRFKNCRSHFVKLRYAYQIVRLAHYSGQWQRTVDLYNFLLPKVDRRRSSVIFYWTLGHLAGALRQLGKDSEAAYRYALIFRNCPSKRISAYRSFFIKNDEQWVAAMRLCQNDAERAGLHVLRAAGDKTLTINDLKEIYRLDPKHPALDLLLVGNVQFFEKMLLRTPTTDRKYGTTRAAAMADRGAKQLPVLLDFVRKALKEREINDPKLWRLVEGYLLQLAARPQEAENIYNEISEKLDPGASGTNDAGLRDQIEIWRTLAQVLSIDGNGKRADDITFQLRSLRTFKEFPAFEPFLQDWLGAKYAEGERPGKAILAAYGLEKFALNPDLATLDDMLATVQDEQKSGIEYEMTGDSSNQKFEAKVLEIKGFYLFSLGQPEAALATLRQIPATQATTMPRFSPFNQNIPDCWKKCRNSISAVKNNYQNLTRREIVERLGELEFDAKAASATGEIDRAAEKYLLVGLGYYNTSWFGYEWEAFDQFRDPDNWSRLSAGPVFPMVGTPAGNRENLDLTRALGYFERALSLARDPEVAAEAAFMAAKCQQKQWLCDRRCKYRPGSRNIAALPPEFKNYYFLLKKDYSNTNFYGAVVRECKWFSAYVR